MLIDRSEGLTDRIGRRDKVGLATNKLFANLFDCVLGAGLQLTLNFLQARPDQGRRTPQGFAEVLFCLERRMDKRAGCGTGRATNTLFQLGQVLERRFCLGIQLTRCQTSAFDDALVQFVEGKLKALYLRGQKVCCLMGPSADVLINAAEDLAYHLAAAFDCFRRLCDALGYTALHVAEMLSKLFRMSGHPSHGLTENLIEFTNLL